MNITPFTEFRHNAGTVPLGSVLEKIRNGSYAGSIQSLREAVESGDEVRAGALKKALPAFTLSAVYSGRRVAVDPSGKDVGRLCFVSHDPDIYIDPDKTGAGLPLMELPPPPEAAKKLKSARRMTTRKMEYREETVTIMSSSLP